MNLVKTGLRIQDHSGLRAGFARDDFVRIGIVPGAGSTVETKRFAFVAFSAVIVNDFEIPGAAGNRFCGVGHVGILKMGACGGIRIYGVDRRVIHHHESDRNGTSPRRGVRIKTAFCPANRNHQFIREWGVIVLLHMGLDLLERKATRKHRSRFLPGGRGLGAMLLVHSRAGVRRRHCPTVTLVRHRGVDVGAHGPGGFGLRIKGAEVLHAEVGRGSFELNGANVARRALVNIPFVWHRSSEGIGLVPIC